MNGTGWPSHDEDEKARIVRCYTEADQPSGCPLCIARGEIERLRKVADRAYEDIGNILYNIETGELREAELQVREVRHLLDAAIARPGEGHERPTTGRVEQGVIVYGEPNGEKRG